MKKKILKNNFAIIIKKTIIFPAGTFPDHVIGEEVIADYLLYSLNRQNIET